MAEVFESIFTLYYQVPKIYWEYTNERVLTMEFCEGGQVDDREYMKKHGINVNEVKSTT